MEVVYDCYSQYHHILSISVLWNIINSFTHMSHSCEVLAASG